MDSGIRRRTVTVGGRKTSISIEDAFWDGVRDLAAARKTTITALVGSIDRDRLGGNLSSSIRLAVLAHYRTRPAGAVDRGAAS